MVHKLDSKMCLNALHVILAISVLVEGQLLMGFAMQAGIVHVELIHLCLIALLIAVVANVALDFTAL